MKRFITPSRHAAGAFVLAFLVTFRPAGAASPSWTQASTTAHGVRLTLSIRRSSYPQNALVRVWARMQNVTSHRLFFLGPGPQAAGQYVPQAVVLATPGGEPLPISLTDYMPYPGPPPEPIPLPAGAVRNIPELVILRGPLVRLDLTLAAGSSLPARSGPTISTPLLRLNLTAPDTPTLTLQVPPARPSATFVSSGPVHGPLLGVWSEVCGASLSQSDVVQNIFWTSISRRFGAACTTLLGWHEIAGWLNHSVGQIDWGASTSG